MNTAQHIRGLYLLYCVKGCSKVPIYMLRNAQKEDGGYVYGRFKETCDQS